MNTVNSIIGKAVVLLVAGLVMSGLIQKLPGADNQPPQVQPRQADGNGAIEIVGDLKQWHKTTLNLAGPFAHELDQSPNPFTDYRMTVTFRHESGNPRYEVPGYFAADGRAAETSAQAGTVWRAHVSPDRAGEWTYQVEFVRAVDVALHPERQGQRVSPYYGRSGKFVIRPTDKTGRDFRGKGRLQYVGKHHLRFAATGQYFFKAGPDAPETLLAYSDFDNTVARKKNVSLKTWKAHVKDWQAGDPTWQKGKGKGLIGALNYLASKGLNSFSFLPYNAGGDGDNIWPFVDRDDKLHYDCSKLDQWQIVFDHANAQGLYLHFKLQENEIDDDRRGHEAKAGTVRESMDGGKLGPERRLYCRELIARFGHELALNWNLGEENTQSTEEQLAMAQFINDLDPYDHLIVIHTFPDQQDKVYSKLLGPKSAFTGASLQNSWQQAHRRVLKWIDESARAGKPWVVANDEQNPASMGVPPDPGYKGHDGKAKEGKREYDLHDVRQLTLWGTLMAGGAGVEYYFGYQLPENDLVCEDFRSRDRSWDFCRIAIDFLMDQKIPFWEMANADELVGNKANDNRRFALALVGQLYLVYLPRGGSVDLDLSGAGGTYKVAWFNPRTGGALAQGSISEVKGGAPVGLGHAPEEKDSDWLVVVRK